jgi:hypothetical protein
MPSPKRSDDLPPALIYWLMVGPPDDSHFTPFRIHGWYDALMTAADPDLLEAIWQEHGEALSAEAREAGFEPWYLTQPPAAEPYGAEAVWAKTFYDRWRY